MKGKERQKMCWNCDADVTFDATFCPFCGSDLLGGVLQETEGDGDMFSGKSLDESLASLYKPPYSVREQKGFGVPKTKSRAFSSEDEASVSDDLDEEPLVRHRLGGGWPLILLSVGGQLMTLGLLLFFFSSGGKLSLEWNAKYWFIYCIAAMPIVYFGWRMLNESSVQEEFEEL